MNRAWEIEALTEHSARNSISVQTSECGTQAENVSVHSDLAKAEAVLKENAWLWGEITDSMAERSQLRSVDGDGKEAMMDLKMDEMRCLAVSSVDSTVATGGRQCLALWNRNGRVSAKASVDGEVFCVALSGDG